MRILVIGINYAPEEIGIGENTTQLCEYLVSQGHNVSVITTFPYYPEWKIRRPYRGKVFMRETINGVVVYRGYSCVPRVSTNAFQRITHDTSFAVSSFFIGLFTPRADIIFCISPPLQGGISAYLLSKIKGAVFILQVKDLVPDLAITLGILKNSFLIKMARMLERFVYSRARTILVICQGFVENLVSKGVPKKKLILLPNWVDTERIKPRPRENRFRTSNDFTDRFVVLYSGNMGAKQKLENVIEAARHLDGAADILFLLVGDGPRRKSLEKIASGISNVRFMPLQPKDIVPYMLAASDVLLLNQGSTVVDMVIPYKLLVYMAAGRPVAASVHSDSETARYIRLADCGVVVPPESPAALADAIRTLSNDRKLMARFGHNGRAFSESNFAKKTVLKKYLDFFTSRENEK